MLITYTLQIIQFDVALRCLPTEIEETDMVIVFEMHNVEMELTNDDIVMQKEVTFILNVPSKELVPECATMTISAYKYHPTGIKVLIGSTRINIKIFVNFALATMGDIIAVPGYYVLKNPSGINGGVLSSAIQLMIVDETILGLEEDELFQPELPEVSRSGNDGLPATGKAAEGEVSRLEASYRL